MCIRDRGGVASGMIGLQAIGAVCCGGTLPRRVPGRVRGGPLRAESFLEEVKKIKYKNLAVEMLRKLIEGKIHYSSRKNITLSEKFSERLKKAMNAYKNKALTNFEIMEELMKMAKEYKEAEQKGADLGLTEDELAFYDAITKDENIFKAEGMSDQKLVEIVKDLADTITRLVHSRALGKDKLSKVHDRIYKSYVLYR